MARSTLSPELAPARHLWPESLRSATDAALARFEAEVRALSLPSDEEILGVVKRLVLTLNKINDEHVRSGKTGYETDERDELCDYINASLQQAGIDVQALETRHGAQRGDLAGKWPECFGKTMRTRPTTTRSSGGSIDERRCCSLRAWLRTQNAYKPCDKGIHGCAARDSNPEPAD